jgi:heme exporter protein B
MLKAFYCVLLRDLTLTIRRKGEWMMPVIYFLMIACLFPLALEPDPDLLTKLAPGIIWVAIVLSLIMSLENIFRLDYQEGSLEHLVLSPYPLAILLIAKSLAHWLAIGLPLLILAPVIGLLFHLPPLGLGILLITFLIGIPLISLIGMIGVALTIGLHRGGLLLAVLVLPLMMPVIIFAASSVAKASSGQPYYAELLLLMALLVLALGFVPMAVSAALKISLE